MLSRTASRQHRLSTLVQTKSTVCSASGSSSTASGYHCSLRAVHTRVCAIPSSPSGREENFILAPGPARAGPSRLQRTPHGVQKKTYTPLHGINLNLRSEICKCKRNDGTRTYGTLGPASELGLASSTQVMRTMREGREEKKRTLVLSDAQRRTIYALSTPQGKAGVGVIRISGPDARKAWHEMVRTKKEKNGIDPKPWLFHRCRVVHPETGETLDEGLAVFFKGVSIEWYWEMRIEIWRC